MDPLLLDIPSEVTTERLILRIPRAGDGKLVNEGVLESIEELRPWMPWVTPTPDLDNSESYCRRAAMKFLAREQLNMIMFLRNSGQFAGAIGMHDIAWKVPKFEIGYWLRTSLSGRGLMTEAVLALTDFAFQTLKAQRVEIRMDDRNARSWRVAERAGFQLEGILRKDTRAVDDQVRDTRVYAQVAS